MSSPKMTRMLGFFFSCAWAACASNKPASSAAVAVFSKRMGDPSLCETCGSLARKHRLPIVLHVDDGPPPLRGFVQRPVELPDVRVAVVGPLALGVGVLDDHRES